MSDMTLQELAKAMGKIDFAMLTTRTEGGRLATRPMSNNGDVEFDGDSFYFSWDTARTVSDIAKDPQVALSFQGKAGILGKPPLYVAIEGTADIVRDKSAFAAHWNADLERWFPEGIYTQAMVMLHVHADRIHYWDGSNEGRNLSIVLFANAPLASGQNSTITATPAGKIVIEAFVFLRLLNRARRLVTRGRVIVPGTIAAALYNADTISICRDSSSDPVLSDSCSSFALAVWAMRLLLLQATSTAERTVGSIR